MSRSFLLSVIAIAIAPCSDVPHRSVVGGAPVTPAAIAVDDETVVGGRHFLRGYPARDDGDVNAVIEIPSGTTAKFEVDEANGWLAWQHDREHGARREIDYLPFPANYGMVPRTLGGDGDALDILVLGRGIERAHVAKTRVIGVLMMGDADERDDKLIAVPTEAALANGFTRLHDLEELDADYPAAREILELWFANYWGAGNTHVLGWGDTAEAEAILDDAERAFTQARRVARRTPPDAATPRLRATPPAAARVRSLRQHADRRAAGSAY